MEFDELFIKLKVNPLKLIESIVHAGGSSVILFKNRKSEILIWLIDSVLSKTSTV